jgi:hypothetical protein
MGPPAFPGLPLRSAPPLFHGSEHRRGEIPGCEALAAARVFAHRENARGWFKSNEPARILVKIFGGFPLVSDAEF